jgi:hypothetical protein
LKEKGKPLKLPSINISSCFPIEDSLKFNKK